MSFPQDNPPDPVRPPWPTTPPPPQGNYPPQGAYPASYATNYAPQYAPRWVPSAPPPPARMPKARALWLAGRMKRWLIVGSVLSFGALIGLVSHNVVGVTAAQQASPVTTSQQQPDNSDDGGFFGQQGGFGFGSNGPSQAPVSHSSVS